MKTFLVLLNTLFLINNQATKLQTYLLFFNTLHKQTQQCTCVDKCVKTRNKKKSLEKEGRKKVEKVLVRTQLNTYLKDRLFTYFLVSCYDVTTCKSDEKEFF